MVGPQMVSLYLYIYVPMYKNFLTLIFLYECNFICPYVYTFHPLFLWKNDMPLNLILCFECGLAITNVDIYIVQTYVGTPHSKIFLYFSCVRVSCMCVPPFQIFSNLSFPVWLDECKFIHVYVCIQKY